jgi:hypothetical protein
MISRANSQYNMYELGFMSEYYLCICHVMKLEHTVHDNR